MKCVSKLLYSLSSQFDKKTSTDAGKELEEKVLFTLASLAGKKDLPGSASPAMLMVICSRPLRGSPSHKLTLPSSACRHW